MTTSPLSRRDFAFGAATIGAAAAAGLLGSCTTRAAAPTAAAAGRIDVHHHFLPPSYLDIAREPLVTLARGPGAKLDLSWSAKRDIETMDQNGIAAALLSITAPGVWIGNPTTGRLLARQCNEYAAEVVHDHPKRFGSLAALPLPDTDASLAELIYVMDVLNADGICLMSSYGTKWLGHADFNPVFTELNRRAAIVFVHPTAAACCANLIPDVPASFIEFPLDTTRVIVNLLVSGTFARFPAIRFIFSHGGGAVPMLSQRIARLAALPNLATRVPGGVDAALKKLFYDTVSVTNAPAFAALSALVPVSQIVFGTDFPLGAPVGEAVAGLAALGLSPDDLHRIERGNAGALFPRLAA
jgi:predicted TIM-barrel fold metal-dependent hydrolase